MNPYKLFNGIFIPEHVARYRSPSNGVKVVYGRLVRYAGEDGRCFPSIATLAAEVGMGTSQSASHVHELRDKRFIATKERPGTSPLYSFLA